jgi:cellulose synthase (UDP-forming)
MPWRGKLMYISGLFYYLYSAVLIFVSPVVPLLLLLLIPTQIQPRDYLALVPALFSGMLMYPLWHRCKFGPATFPLDIIRSWAHALALADFLTGRKLQWQASGAAVSHVRRLRACLWGWNGGTAAVWLSVLAWRVWQYGPSRFWVLALFALFYAGIVTQILWSYERT